MNLSPDWIPFLRSAGHEAEHWIEIGPPNAPDSYVLAYAHGHQAVVLTHDLDFGAILAYSGDSGPSVIQFREEETSPEQIGLALLSAIIQCSDELQLGALVTVDFHRAKARILPIRRRNKPGPDAAPI